MITVVVAEHLQIVRQSMVALLQAAPGISVVASAEDSEEALRTVLMHRPNVFVVNTTLSGQLGFDVIKKIKLASPDTKVLLLSMHTAKPYILDAVKNGTDGYLLKSESADAFVHAIKEIAGGKHFLSPSLRDTAIEKCFDRLEVA